MSVPPEIFNYAGSIAGYHLSRSMKWLDLIGASVAAAHVSAAIDSANKSCNLNISDMDEDSMGIFAETDAFLERILYSCPS